MRSWEKKFLIVFALALGLWRVFELEPVQNAFFEFLAAGEIPGTNIVLAPDDVFVLLATLFSMTLLLIFRKEFNASFKKRALTSKTKKRPTKAASVKPVVVIKNVKNKNIIIQEEVDRSGTFFPVLYLPAISFRWLKRISMKMIGYVSAGWQKTKSLSARFLRYMAENLRTFWIWLEPHIRVLDKKIEKKLRSYKRTANVIEIIETVARAYAAWRRKLKA